MIDFGEDTPVFEISFDGDITYPNGDSLPPIWITEPFEWCEDGSAQRTYTQIYPANTSESYDPEGDTALHYGAQYYREAMSYLSKSAYDTRVDCFCAAELLYRHSAGRGNAYAYLCLGYIYSYDRCEGQYWIDPATLNTTEDYKRLYPHEERAFECFQMAAQADIAEGCYKLGDMYKIGMGCDPDGREAFRWYTRASELAKHEHPVIIGGIALRLAQCYEDGIGCDVDFARALNWYKQAVAGIEFAVDRGETWYEKRLAQAQAGVKRTQQEVGYEKR